MITDMWKSGLLFFLAFVIYGVLMFGVWKELTSVNWFTQRPVLIDMEGNSHEVFTN